MSDPIYRAHATDKDGQVIVYDTLDPKVAREALYGFLQKGYTAVGLKKVSL